MSGAAAALHFEITLNGEARTIQSGTVWDLLVALGLQEKPIAVERNKAIVGRELFQATPVSPGDSIEIIQFVGGG